MRSVLAESRPTLKLSSLGLFPGAEGVLFLGATVTHELLTFHNRVHAALANQSIKHWPCYLPGNWVPHCTLAVGLKREEVMRATELLHDFAPIVAVVSAIGRTDTTTGEITPLPSGVIG
ncbi:2'-5' RNA ligase family protein [Nonomuraea africana]|uniref:2'-5' RNA ligase family protein n=1 Tax=Nonomuraea africana TaxID=46171 RepID=UPI0033F07C8B